MMEANKMAHPERVPAAKPDILEFNTCPPLPWWKERIGSKVVFFGYVK